MTQKPTLLIVGAPVPVIEQGLAPHFDIVREPRAGVRGLAVAGGHVRIDGALMAQMPALEIVASLGVGYDHVDAREAARRGVVVTHTPDVLTGEVADLAMCLLLATIRQIPQSDRYVRAGHWLKGNFPLTTTLRERKVGILGLGRIGKAIARRLQACDVTVEYHGRKPQPDVPYTYHPTLLGMAQSCSVLLVAASGGPESHHIVNAEVLKALGPDGIVVNVGRGTVIDEAALVRALQDKTILSAGLDVFEHEPQVPQALVDLDHVVLLPHVGSASVYTRKAMAQLVVDNLLSWFAGRGALTAVPECAQLPSAKRLA
jgi:lactate dehydrogenase-like 2-hydroxyacid dehydrogenase